MQPLKLTESLRVRDADESQYVIERRNIHATTGAETWIILAYCREVKNLAANALERVEDEYAARARKEAGLYFAGAGFGAILSELPPKTKPEKKPPLKEVQEPF